MDGLAKVDKKSLRIVRIKWICGKGNSRVLTVSQGQSKSLNPNCMIEKHVAIPG